MAVPSSGELSLTGIALEMITNTYQSYVTLNDGQNNLGDIIVGPTSNYPQSTGDNGFYSPIYALEAEDTHPNPLTGITRDTGTPFMGADGNSARALADISLAGLHGGTASPGLSRVASSQSPFNPGGAAPVTEAHAQTYLSTDPGGFVSAPGSTIMYTIFRGGSNGSGQHIIGAYVYSYGNSPPEVGPNKFAFSSPAGALTPGDPQSPLQEAPLSVVHPAPIGLNTSNPPANRPLAPPATPTNPGARMSEFYDYDHDFQAAASPGVYMGPALFTGPGGTTLHTYNIDLSSSDYANGTLTGGYPGAYLIFAYKNGSSGPNSFKGDLQVTEFDVNGTTEDFAPPYPHAPTQKWFTSTASPSSSTPLPATPANAVTAYNNIKSSMSGIPGTPGGTPTRWNYRFSGGTPSSSTGVSDPTGYIYAETSGGGTNKWCITRLQIPNGTWSSNDVSVDVYRHGVNIGSLFVGVELL